ncbi:MAG: cupin domain-containing protein [Defluviitaleaceae bacterium]|nr:cupin domain-containing protein [Defluviitaleaceae bacterium]
MENFNMAKLGALSNVKGKLFLREQLGLTGCEISISKIDAGQTSPFIHTHKENEEIFIFLKGSGVLYIDGQTVALEEGSVVKVKPAGARSLKADSDLVYICIQTKEGSLKQATRDDGVILEGNVVW